MTPALQARPTRPRSAPIKSWRKARWGVRLKDALNLGLVLLVVNLLCHNFGPISAEWSKAFALFLLLALFFSNLRFPVHWKNSTLVLSGFLALGISSVMLASSRSDIFAVAMAPIALWGLGALLKGLGGGLRLNSFYLLSAWLYAVVRLFSATIPFLTDFVTKWSLGWTEGLGRTLTQQPIALGPSGMGGSVLASLLCCQVVAVIRGWGKRPGRASRFWWALAVLLISNIAYLRIQNEWRFLPQDALPLFYSQSILVVLAVVLFGFLRAPAAGPPLPSGFKAGWAIAVTLLVLGVFGMVVWPLTGTKKGKKLLFYDVGYLDWKRPVFGKYGGYEAGMFGCLPDYLKDDGFTSGFARSVSSNSLAATDVLVIINPTNRWAGGELEAIWNFVDQGGSLLVLGDHTDLLGSQGILNSLLAPIATRFNFDSGFPAKTEWQSCLTLLEHPMCQRVGAASEAIISVGGTLDIRPPAFAMIRGRYGFGDLGNRLNAQGAFLGDYRYEKGEQLGDVVLVAAAFFGKGKVLVFGDTSPFQNGALPFSYFAFVQPIFEWLIVQDWSWIMPVKCVGALLVVAAAFLLVRRASARAIVLVCFAFGFAVLAGERFNARQLPAPAQRHQIALLDRSHGNRISLAPLQKDSVGPFTATLQRYGFVPISFNEWTDQAVREASLFVTTAPTQPYSRHQLGVLKTFVENGGILLMNSGWEEKGGAMQGLLDHFGMDVLRIPLGPFPVNRTVNHLLNQPQFINAWPVAMTDPGAQADFARARANYRSPVLDKAQEQRLDSLVRNLFDPGGPPEVVSNQPPARSAQSPAAIEVLFQTEEGLPLVLAQRMGKGAVVVVGDTFFLGHDNLESLRFYRQGNILFLKYLFDELGRRGL